MEKNNASKAQPLVGIILTALAVVLLAGLLTFAGPCAVQAGEEARSCLWASRALIGVDAVLLIIALCSDPSTHCNAVMRPFALALGIAVALTGGIDLTRRLLALRKR